PPPTQRLVPSELSHADSAASPMFEPYWDRTVATVTLCLVAGHVVGLVKIRRGLRILRYGYHSNPHRSSKRNPCYWVGLNSFVVSVESAAVFRIGPVPQTSPIPSETLAHTHAS